MVDLLRLVLSVSFLNTDMQCSTLTKNGIEDFTDTKDDESILSLLGIDLIEETETP